MHLNDYGSLWLGMSAVGILVNLFMWWYVRGNQLASLTIILPRQARDDRLCAKTGSGQKRRMEGNCWEEQRKTRCVFRRGLTETLPEKDRKVRKWHLLSHFYIKMIILPRQARDKHRENSKKCRFLVAA